MVPRNALLFSSLPFSLDAPKHQDRRKAATLRNGETPRLCPSETLNTTVLRSLSLADSFVAPPAPIVPNGGCAQSQSFPLPKLSRAVLIVVRCAASPLRASPASAPLLRDLLTAVTPSKRVPNFCVRYSVRSFLAPVSNLKIYITCYIDVVLISTANSLVWHFGSQNRVKTFKQGVHGRFVKNCTLSGVSEDRLVSMCLSVCRDLIAQIQCFPEMGIHQVTGDYHWHLDGGPRNRKSRPLRTAFA